jgi:hypothetical protein
MNDEAIFNSLTNEEWASGYPDGKTPQQESKEKALDLSVQIQMVLNGHKMDHVFDAMAMTIVELCYAHARKNKTLANAALLDFFGHTIEIQREGSTHYDFRK